MQQIDYIIFQFGAQGGTYTYGSWFMIIMDLVINKQDFAGFYMAIDECLLVIW